MLYSLPRRLCAPSFLRLMLPVLSLTLGTLFLPFASHAGTYTWTTTDASGKVTAQSPTFTGGTVVVVTSLHPLPTRGHPIVPPAFSTGGGHYTGGGGCVTSTSLPNNAPASVKVNSPANPIVATFTWQATSATDLPPSAVIVEQDCTAQWSQETVTNDGSATGTADCGLPGPPPTVTKDANGTVTGVSNSGTKYSVQTSPGTSFSVPAQSDGQYQPSATFSANAGTTGAASGGASIDYHVQAFPVFVIPSGCNPAYQALTGQQIQATLSEPNGLPSGTKITSYTWSFSGGTKGNPIRNWDGNGVAVDGTTPQQLFPFLNADLSQTDTTGNGISINPISFYDQAADTITAKCAVSLTFPDGTTGSINASSTPVTFMKPTANWTASATPPLGPQFDPSATGSMGFDVQWNATVAVPSPFSGGLGCFAQIVKPTIQFQRTPTGNQPINCYLEEPQQNADGSTTYVLPNTGLDTYFPYQNSLTTHYSQGYTWDVSGAGQSGDAPSAGFNTPASDNGGSNWYSAYASGTFTTWLMYLPPASTTGPGGTIWVPLQRVDWSWTGNTVKNKATGSWNAATNSSPAVTGSTSSSGITVDNPPQWTSTNVGSAVLRP